jgi:hypothetical protein
VERVSRHPRHVRDEPVDGQHPGDARGRHPERVTADDRLAVDALPMRRRSLAMSGSSSTQPKSTATERTVGQHEGDHHPMSTSSTAPVVSRRTALAGLGAGALGLALARSGFTLAQDATPAIPRATHPIFGAWLITRYPGTSDEGQSIGVFAETGLYAELLWDRNVTLGEWRPTDDNSVELSTFTKWLISFDDYFVPAGEDVAVPEDILTSEMGTARVPDRIDLDDSGNRFVSNGIVWLYDTAGVTTNSFGIFSTGERLSVAAPAATPTT